MRLATCFAMRFATCFAMCFAMCAGVAGVAGVAGAGCAGRTDTGEGDEGEGSEGEGDAAEGEGDGGEGEGDERAFTIVGRFCRDDGLCIESPLPPPASSVDATGEDTALFAGAGGVLDAADDTLTLDAAAPVVPGVVSGVVALSGGGALAIGQQGVLVERAADGTWRKTPRSASPPRVVVALAAGGCDDPSDGAGTAAECHDDDVWALGRGRPGEGVYRRSRADGAWSLSEASATGGAALTAAAPDNVWLAGSDGSVKHFDGSAWSEIVSAAGPVTFVGAAFSPSAHEVWLARGATLVRVVDDGTSDVVALADVEGAPAQVSALAGRAPDDVFAFSSNDRDAGRYLHFDGSAWSVVEDARIGPVTAAAVGGVGAQASLWLAGRGAGAVRLDAAGVVTRPPSLGAPPIALDVVAGARGDDVDGGAVAIVENGDVAARRAGEGGWRTVAHAPGLRAPFARVAGEIWGLLGDDLVRLDVAAAIDDDGAAPVDVAPVVVATGIAAACADENGDVYVNDGAGDAFFVGGVPSPLTPGAPAPLRALCPAPRTAYLLLDVGSSAPPLAVHDATLGRATLDGPREPFGQHSFVAAVDDVWVAETLGPVEHWDGAGWAVLDDLGDFHARDVGGTSADDVWFVGQTGSGEGVAVHFDGAGFSTVDAGADVGNEALVGVSARARDDVFIVGSAGSVRHFDGAGFTTARPSLPGAPGTVFLTAADVVGTAGADLHAFAVGAADDVLWRVDLEAGAPAWTVSSTMTASDGVFVRALADDDVWVAFRGAGALHYDGLAWSAPVGLAASVTALAIGGAGDVQLAADDGNTYAVDDTGAVAALSTVPNAAFAESWPLGPYVALPDGTHLLAVHEPFDEQRTRTYVEGAAGGLAELPTLSRPLVDARTGPDGVLRLLDDAGHIWRRNPSGGFALTFAPASPVTLSADEGGAVLGDDDAWGVVLTSGDTERHRLSVTSGDPASAFVDFAPGDPDAVAVDADANGTIWAAQGERIVSITP